MPGPMAETEESLMLVPTPPRNHDHSVCIETALSRAADLCARRDARLTQSRRQILELVWDRHEPVTAYDLVETLRGITGKRVDPPTIYRALDFLIDQGLVHRIEGLNAFVGCSMPEARHAGQFLICGQCGTIRELDEPEIARAVTARAQALGFAIERQTIEVYGRCVDCQRETAA